MPRDEELIIGFCSHTVCTARKGDRFTYGMILRFLKPWSGNSFGP